jgi:hypothetical protein
MARNHILKILVCWTIAWAACGLLSAAEHHGIVKFAGLPVPGATITATMGDKKLVAITDPQGLYTFADLADGVWNVQVEMLCFATLTKEVAIAPNAPSPEWELKLLPFDEIKAAAPPPSPSANPPTAGTPAAPPQTAGALTSPPPTLVEKAAAPKKGSKAAIAAAAASAANSRPGFQRADLNASGAPPRNQQPRASTRPRRAPATPYSSTAA